MALLGVSGASAVLLSHFVMPARGAGAAVAARHYAGVSTKGGQMNPRSIVGIHDPGGEHLLGGQGWLVFTETVDSAPGDYRQWAGYNIVVRLNNGYAPAGTIPPPDRYPEFARKCAAWVAGSQGVDFLVIGNEIAHRHEWPTGQPITLSSYLDCYRLCYDAIKTVAPHVKIAPQAVAPWNDSTPDAPDWILQLTAMLTALPGRVDWIALHAYTREYSLDAFVSDARMGPPYAHRYAGWETLYEFMAAIPQALRHLPVVITEVNGNAPWSAYQPGWLQTLYAQIDGWNATPDNQQIMGACLFRWAEHDQQWTFSQCAPAHGDLRAVVAKGYQWREVQPTAEKGYVTAQNGLRLRSDGNLAADTLGVLGYGAEVAILARTDDFLKVAHGDVVGWVFAAYVSKDKPNTVYLPLVSNPDGRDAIVKALSAEYGVDERLAKAVLAVESGGSGFQNGRLVLRLEPHVLRSRLEALFSAQGFAVGSPPWDGSQHRYKGQPFHGNQDKEHATFADVLARLRSVVFESASYGAGQIMGFNYGLTGYASAEAMYDAFDQSEEKQLRAMFDYFKNKVGNDGRSALDCLRAGDLVGFARLYNGIGQEESYAGLIRQAMGQ